VISLFHFTPVNFQCEINTHSKLLNTFISCMVIFVSRSPLLNENINFTTYGGIQKLFVFHVFVNF
jgi:hypothetical protein